MKLGKVENRESEIWIGPLTFRLCFAKGEN